MNNKVSLVGITLFIFTLISNCFAYSETKIKLIRAENGHEYKTIVLMPVTLSAEQKQHFLQVDTTTALDIKDTNLPSKITLAMNDVPVLDQGEHGTCVTFAVTAAIDALLKKGDYISQMCNLELGMYLMIVGYYPSGWEGTTGAAILSQISQFGIVNNENMMQKGCAGAMAYPPNSFFTGLPMQPMDFKLLSESINNQISWYSLLTFDDRMRWNSAAKSEPAQLLYSVKKHLASSTQGIDLRLTFGVLLPSKYCSAGACGTYQQKNDAWVLSNKIAQDKNPVLAGHEMIITGYDDNAVAMDEEGKPHRGLLFLRNSWGNNVGDHGEFYMSYDFFKRFTRDVEVILLNKNA